MLCLAAAACGNPSSLMLHFNALADARSIIRPSRRVNGLKWELTKPVVHATRCHASNMPLDMGTGRYTLDWCWKSIDSIAAYTLRHAHNSCDPPFRLPSRYSTCIVPDWSLRTLPPMLISISAPHAQTQASKVCHPRELHKVSISVHTHMPCNSVPGPFTLRIILRVVSSMNSTRTWVTPPREPLR